MSADRTIPTALRAALVVLLLVPFTLIGATAWAAQPLTNTAYLRLAHLSPDTPPVDVSVVAVADPSRRLDVPGVAYGAVSDYQMLAPGSYTVSMRSAGAAPDSPAVITTTFTAAPAEAVTVAGLGDYADLALRVLRDDLSPPPPGQAKVRIINAAPATPTLDVALAGGPVIASAVPYAGSSEYRTMPIGAWNLTVGTPGSPGAELPVTLDANAVYSVLLVTKAGSLAAEIRTDGAGASATPTGSVPAGYGGLADRGAAAAGPVPRGSPPGGVDPRDVPGVWALAVPLLVLVFGTIALRRAGRRPRNPERRG